MAARLRHLLLVEPLRKHSQLQLDMEAMLLAPADTVVNATSETRLQFSHPPGYLIDDALGRGGMGVVYRARQEDPRKNSP